MFHILPCFLCFPLLRKAEQQVIHLLHHQNMYVIGNTDLQMTNRDKTSNQTLTVLVKLGIMCVRIAFLISLHVRNF